MRVACLVAALVLAAAFAACSGTGESSRAGEANAGSAGFEDAVPGNKAGGILSIGVSAVDITPVEPIRLSGYGSRREPASESAQRLYAKAIAFGDSAVLITADLVGLSSDISDEVARRLASTAGIERANIVLAVTHTHTGPQLRGVLPNLFGEPIPAEHEAAINRYTDRLINLLEAVALDALARRRPSRLAWGNGKLDFAANRRVLENGKWTGFGVNPDGPVDHTMPMLRVTDADGALRAVLLSYACHCTTLTPGFNELHGDWAGIAAEQIERRHPGALALVTIGCGGDQNPAPRGSLDAARAHGAAVADEVDRLLESALEPVRNAPTGRFRRIELDFDELPTRSEWQAMAAQGGSPGYHAEVVLDRGGDEPTSLRYPVQAWTFGDELAMIFLGGEVVVDYALRLREVLDADRIWIQAYSNDVMCYIASDRLLDEGGYEVDRSMHFYDQPTRLAYGTEGRIIEAVRDQIPESFHAR